MKNELRSIFYILKRNESKRFFRFILVGLSNTAVSFLSYLLLITFLQKAKGMASIAQLVSYGIGMFWSYIWNRIWVFNSNNSVAKESGKFFVVQVTLMLMSASFIGLLVDYSKFEPILAWIVVMAIVTIVNYLMLRFWAFVKNEKKLNI